LTELNENVKHLELEKSLLTEKLSSIEASLTRWIFRACDYKTELQEIKHDFDELKKEMNEIKGHQNKSSEYEKKFKDLEIKYESEKTQQSKLKLQQATLDADLEHSKQIIKNLNEKLEKLNFDLKNSSSSIESILKEREKQSNDKIGVINKQNESLNSLNQKLEEEKSQMEKENEISKKNLNELKRKIESNENEIKDLKDKLSKFEDKDLKSANDRLKSENQYLSKKIESLLNDNNSIKKKFDTNFLENNSIKCKYDEAVRELNEIRRKNDELREVNETLSLNTISSVSSVPTQTPIIRNHNNSVQTDDFNYELLLRPIQREFEQKLSDHLFKEELFKNEIDQLKTLLEKNDYEFKDLNKKLEIAFKSNSELRERHDYLIRKCDKLTNEMKEQGEEFLKFKCGYEIEIEVKETTVNQQKKFIDYVLSTHPELSKKYNK
jgi:chromosome segregation ATPase